MEETQIYRSVVRGELQAADVRTIGPHGLAVEPAGVGYTRLSVCTDQAGLVGLIRFLHGMGLALVSLESGDPAQAPRV